MTQNHDDFIQTLDPQTQSRLAEITDPDQRSILLDALRRGEEVPPFAWQPLPDFRASMQALVESLGLPLPPFLLERPAPAAAPTDEDDLDPLDYRPDSY